MGPLLIVGGADKSYQTDIYNAFINNCRTNKNPDIAIIANASTNPAVAFSIIEPKLKNAGAGKVELVQTDSFQFLKEADGIWFTGGDQNLIMEDLIIDNNESDLLKLIREKNNQGVIFGGPSAGAAIMSDPMIGGGSSLQSIYSLFENGLENSEDFRKPGLGFLNHGIIDQHFDARSRLGRLIHALMLSNQKIGYGISENTALLVKDNLFTVYGSGGVYVVDCSKAVLDDKRLKNIKISYIDTNDNYNLVTGSFSFHQKNKIGSNTVLSNSHPSVSGVLSPYSDLKDFICRQLLDNDIKLLPFDNEKKTPYITSYLFDNNRYPGRKSFPGFELRFYKLESVSEGFVDDQGHFAFKNIEFEILKKEITIE
ncbi:MAG: cyanophycinase [Spirochaetaceae bacterium]|nr:cyanophycinase [Spirochaetaceae bacterium]